MESGPLACQCITALAGKLNNKFIRPVADGLEIDLPRGATPATTLHWQILPRVNALERNRARYHVAYCGMVAYTFLLRAFEYLRHGRTAMSVLYTIPQEAIGVGFWQAGRGILTHSAPGATNPGHTPGKPLLARAAGGLLGARSRGTGTAFGIPSRMLA